MLAALATLWILTLRLRLALPGLPLSRSLLVSPVSQPPGLLDWLVPSVRPSLLAAVLRGLDLPRLMSRSEQPRQLAVQLASLAFLEDVITHGVQSLLDSPSGLIAPISVTEPVSLARPRSRSRSPHPRLHPIGPAAPSCSASVGPLAWLSRAGFAFCFRILSRLSIFACFRFVCQELQGTCGEVVFGFQYF